jgi:uncharacterized protein YbjT (DUF2867 family)
MQKNLQKFIINSNKEIMNIIVTGSLGNISKPLTKELVGKGHQATVISSKPERQKNIEALGAKAAIGSLENPEFLATTFKDADAVYCMIPFDFKATDQDKYFQKIGDNYVQAIKHTGTKRAVFLSGWTADIVSSYNVNDILSQLSSISVTELRPGSFYTNMYGYINMIKDKGVIMSNYGGEDRIAFVSPNDIATVAAEELTTSFLGRKIRYIASEELTCNEAATILGEAIGKPDLKWITLTDEQMQNGLIQSGIPLQLAKNMVDMQAAMHSGIIFENYKSNRPVLGKIKLNDFAKEFAAVYNQ